MKRKLAGHINSNKKKYILLMLSFVCGMLSGYITVMFFSGEMMASLKEYLAENLRIFLSYSEELDKRKYFSEVFFGSLRQFVLLWAAGLWGRGVFVPPVFMAYKGYVLSFSLAFIVNCYDMKGFVFSLCVIISHNLIKIPALMFASVCSMSHSLKMSPGYIRGRKPSGEGALMLSYCIYIILSLCIYTAGTMVECYVIPYFVFTLAENMI